MVRTSDGRAFRMLNIMDEFTRECLVRRRITSQDVIDQLYELFLFRGVPGRTDISSHSTGS